MTWRMLRRCARCGKLRRARTFAWRDSSGQTGVSKRCVSCRNVGWQRDPTLPAPRYRLRKHAIDRYRERVAPDLTHTQARDRMIRLMADAPLIDAAHAPAWCRAGSYHGPDERRRITAVLLVDDRVAFCIKRTRRPSGYREVISTVMVADGRDSHAHPSR